MDLPIFMVPGQQIKKFAIYRKSSIKNEYGRVLYPQEDVPYGNLYGSISQASQKEQREWKQMGHPISHTVVVSRIAGVDSDFFEAENIIVDPDGHAFDVVGVDDPSGMNVFKIVYCNSR